MKSVLISIQPYYVFLIIARLMGWNIPQEKTVEVRKDFPKDPAWNKRVHIYCSKNRESFNRIPAQYQPFMEKFLGKVLGEFVCDKIIKNESGVDYGVTDDGRAFYCGTLAECTGLTRAECLDYGKKKILCGYELQALYGWHITDLKVYDKPKELGEFCVRCSDRKMKCNKCNNLKQDDYYEPPYCESGGYREIARPPQSWCYVEEL